MLLYPMPEIQTGFAGKGPCPRRVPRRIPVAKRIAVDQARPGQILAEEITRQDGVLLASRSSEITEGLIRMLGRMNIDTVVIEEAEQRTEEDILAEHRVELDRISRAFRRAGDSPVLTALRRTLIFMSEQERDKALEFLELARDPEPPEAHAAADAESAGDADSGAAPGIGPGTVIEMKEDAPPLPRLAAEDAAPGARGARASGRGGKSGRGPAGPAAGKDS
ncbi:MAG: hypothetical protein LBR80_16885 [Deltaproteobacteria bacterium]|jgi:hypothetical protein|nr:hypothetical protein [Deltaproteobacteria bacterium]